MMRRVSGQVFLPLPPLDCLLCNIEERKILSVPSRGLVFGKEAEGGGERRLKEEVLFCLFFFLNTVFESDTKC